MNGDPMLKINAVLEEIENYVADAKRLPLWDRVMIKDDELFHLMDKLRQELPREVSDAIEVCSRRDEILAAAQAEAEQIVAKASSEAEEIMEKANSYAKKTVDESALVVQANEQARNIMEQTEAQAKQLKADTEAQAEQLRAAAEEYTRQLRGDAEHYADQLFDHVLANMQSAMESVHNGLGGAMQAMQQAKEQIHAANERS